jgi:hypothetical protein
MTQREMLDIISQAGRKGYKQSHPFGLMKEVVEEVEKRTLHRVKEKMAEMFPGMRFRPLTGGDWGGWNRVELVMEEGKVVIQPLPPSEGVPSHPRANGINNFPPASGPFVRHQVPLDQQLRGKKTVTGQGGNSLFHPLDLTFE